MRRTTILVILSLASCFFIFFKEGNIDLAFAKSQLPLALYSIIGSFIWAYYLRRSFLIACLLFGSVVIFSFVFKYYFSPTQLVAVIAFLFYLSKIFKPKKK